MFCNYQTYKQLKNKHVFKKGITSNSLQIKLGSQFHLFQILNDTNSPKANTFYLYLNFVLSFRVYN